MILRGKDRQDAKKIKQIYKRISFFSSPEKIKSAQEEIAAFYKEKYSFEFLHLRYYYLTAYETTLSSQISFLFGMATTIAIAIPSKELFGSMGFSNLLSLAFSVLLGLIAVLFFTFRGLYIGIAIGSLVAPVERAYLYPLELSYVKTQLQELKYYIP